MNTSLYEFGQDTKDHAFEPFLMLPQALEVVKETILPACDAKVSRKRKRRKQDEERLILTLVLVVANALKASDHPDNREVHYSRKAETFSGPSIYYRQWLRHTNLINAVDGMAAADFLKTTTGKNDQAASHFGNQPQSTFEATDSLLRLLREAGIKPSDVFKSADAPVVILRGEKHKLINYNPEVAKIRCLIEPVKEYNAFIKRFDLQLDISEQEMVELHATKEKDGRPRPPTDFKNVSLRRIFNNSDFGQGGRWFGGWWITIPSKYRASILIDGKRTAELDYSGFHIRGFYHLNGTDYQEDPYEIEAIRRAADVQGLIWESVRDSIKALTNILINADEWDKIGSFPDLKLVLPKGFKRPKSVYPLIQEKHKVISSVFRTGFGLPMMRMESDVCELILKQGMRKGILVLPVHDSFVVQEEHECWLQEVMLSGYRSLFGFNPKIKPKVSRLETKEQEASSQIASNGEEFLQDQFKGESVMDEPTINFFSDESPLQCYFGDQSEQL